MFTEYLLCSISQIQWKVQDSVLDSNSQCSGRKMNQYNARWQLLKWKNVLEMLISPLPQNFKNCILVYIEGQMICQEKPPYLMNAKESDYSSKILCKCLDHSCHLLNKYFACLIFTTSFLSSHLTIVTFLRGEVETKKSSHICQTQKIKTFVGCSFSSETITHISHLTKQLCSQKIIRQLAYC